MKRIVAVFVIASTAVALSVGVLQAGGSASPTPRARSPITVHSDEYMSPEDRQRTFAQRLDIGLSRAGMRGVIVGTVTGSGTSRHLSGGATPTDVVTDYPFHIQDAYAGSDIGYSRDQDITLRVPGGTVDGQSTRVEGAPEISQGDSLVVVVQDQDSDAEAGPNDARTLAVTSANNVGHIHDNDVVFPAGTLTGAEVRQHFQNHPAK